MRGSSARRGGWRGMVALVLAALLPVAPPVAAQDNPDQGTLPYTIEIARSGDARLDAAAEAVSELRRLREPAPTSALGLVGRARIDADRLRTALQSEGYYDGTAAITIAGEPAEAPGLADRLDGRREPVPVRITLTPGPQYRIARVAVTAEASSSAAALAEATAEPFGVAQGDPARAAPVLDASGTVIDRLRRSGHPLAAMTGREVVVDHDTRSMDVAWRFSAGPRARFATPAVTGAQRVDPGLLNRVAARRLQGREYSPERVESARRALLGLGPLGSVREQPATEPDENGEFPVTFIVAERPFRAIGVNVAYETNYGLAGRVYWEHRNLFGGAERLRLEGEVSRIGSGAGVEDINYRAFATLRFPEVFRRNVQLVAQIGAVRERLEPYDRDVALASAIFEHPLSEWLIVQAGPGYEVGRVGRNDVWTNVNLVSMTFGARWDSTNSLLDPTRGIRANLAAVPYFSLNGGDSFTRVLASASTYVNLFGNGRSVIALRGAVGSALGATRDEIPYDKRFYAGGGGSVRGFPYLSIGPRDAANQPLGGASLVELNAEWRQRIGRNWAVVGFVDAASIGNTATPTLSDFRIGVGAGVRYFTSIGPIRVDVAVPMNPEPNGPGYGLYVGIGQAF